MRFIFLLLFPFFCFATEVQVKAQGGYRHDNFKWEISNPLQKELPVLSRLTWKDLEIFEMGLSAQALLAEQWMLSLSGDYGWILKGKNRDADFRIPKGTHKIEEYSRSDNNAGNGNVWDMGIRLGYPCGDPCQVRWIPYVGFSGHAQNLRFNKLHFKIKLDIPEWEGTTRHSSARYDARWWGPSIGLGVEKEFFECTQVYFAGEFRWLEYHGTGRWGKSKALLKGPFHQTGSGPGAAVFAGFDTALCGPWNLGLEFQFQMAQVKHGKDRYKYQKSGTSTIREHTLSLRSVHWQSLSLLLSITRSF